MERSAPSRQRTRPSVGAPHYVYLDQNKWIDLAKAYHRRSDGERFSGALVAAEHAVAAGSAVFPLSTTHYIETSLGGGVGSRARLAEVMERVSRFATIADQQVVVPYELDVAIAHLFERPEPDELELFGEGAAFAFRDPQCRGRDRVILRGSFHPAGARDAHRQIDDTFRQARAAQQQMFRDRGFGSGSKLRQAAVGRTVADVIDPVLEALDRTGVTFDSFLERVGDDLAAFLNELPSRSVMLELQLAQDAGAAKFDHGDLRDLGALAVAIAYCDVVVTEKQWTDIARKSGVDVALNTIVTNDIRELGAILGSS